MHFKLRFEGEACKKPKLSGENQLQFLHLFSVPLSIISQALWEAHVAPGTVLGTGETSREKTFPSALEEEKLSGSSEVL